MSARIRVLVVDDEPLARERLLYLLAREPDVEILGACGDGREALSRIREERPELVFLDVRMPEMDGLALAAALGDQPPVLIFVTAYDQYALQAFEVNALDYLLKPFDRERFSRSLERARARLRAPPAPVEAQLAALFKALPRQVPPERICLKNGASTLYLAPEEIRWIESAGNYLILHLRGRTHLERSTMGELLERLPPRFVRVHRSAIVNADEVLEIRALSGREYQIVLRDGAEIPMSRRYLEDLQRVMDSSSYLNKR